MFNVNLPAHVTVDQFPTVPLPAPHVSIRLAPFPVYPELQVTVTLLPKVVLAAIPTLPWVTDGGGPHDITVSKQANTTNKFASLAVYTVQ